MSCYRAKLKRTDPDDYRRRRREEQRRYRARRYSAGLSSTGKPLERPDIAAARREYADHPADCLCYGCLYPPEPYQPKVCRSGAMK
jgi:hypothetical protein